MPNLPALLASIPDEYKPMAALVIGAFMLVFLVLLHGTGLHGILVLRKRRELRLRAGPPRLVKGIFLFASTIFLMLALHIVGFMLWAYALLLMGLVPHAYDAIYFCANAYTTLGYGNVDLGSHWRIISPIIGISGLFTFAWTTSALVNVVASHNKLIEQLEIAREQEIRKRLTALKDEWNHISSSGSADSTAEPSKPGK
jgi:hypothetical protein